MKREICFEIAPEPPFLPTDTHNTRDIIKECKKYEEKIKKHPPMS